MTQMPNDINDLINGSFAQESLKDLFDKKLIEMGITQRGALNLLDMERKTLNGILTGTLKKFDTTNFLKLAGFLNKPRELVTNLFFDSLLRNHSADFVSPEEVEFVKENFDLAVLKKANFIKSITDFKHITETINAFFGYKTIYEYRKPTLKPAFSEGLIEPKNELTRAFFIETARSIFETIDNPNSYDRKALIEFFPKIRKHSTDVKLGLKMIFKALYKLGITVLYVPSLPTLQLRGATFSVNDKPCIAITNFVGFYSTLWWCLIHELFHVMFDWEEIKSNTYHLSEDNPEEFSVKEKEDEANQFARDYLFSKEKLDRVKYRLNEEKYIEEFARVNHVHTSLIYVFNAFEKGSGNRTAWALARSKSPYSLVKEAIGEMDNPWEKPLPIYEYVKLKISKITI